VYKNAIFVTAGVPHTFAAGLPVVKGFSVTFGTEGKLFLSKVAFTRQTNVGQLVLANSNWCV